MRKQKKAPKRAGSADRLTKATKKGGIELTEKELDRISGGPTAVEYAAGVQGKKVKIDF